METTTKCLKYFELVSGAEVPSVMSDQNLFVKLESFCSCCGQPLKNISSIPDIMLNEIIKKSEISFLNDTKGGVVHLISKALLEKINEIISVYDYFIFGKVFDKYFNEVDDYVSFLTKYRVYIRGETFFSNVCHCCDFMIYNYYQKPYLPIGVLESKIPIFSTVGSGLLVNEEIAHIIKLFKFKKISLYNIKVKEEKGMNSLLPLYTNHY